RSRVVYGCRILERGKAVATRRSVQPVRLFLRRARSLRNGAAASGFGRRSSPGRSFRHDDEPAKMAVTFVALHCEPASGPVRRWRDRGARSYLAGGGLENKLPCLRETARLFDVRAHAYSQG